MKRSVWAIAIALQLSLIAGCGMFSKTVNQDQERTVEEYYADAVEQMNDKNYEAAIKTFEALEARYPYGRYAQQAQLQIAFANYRRKNIPEAIAACDRFIKQNPTSPAIDYAYYLKGLANFNSDLGLFGFLADNDLADRDPKAAKESYDSFKEVVTRFPESRYAPDAQARMDYLTNALARYEIQVARYYLKRGAMLAAANRAQYVVTTYPQTPAIEDALAVMIQAYDKLGLQTLRDDTIRVMEQNFPQRVSKNDYNDRPWWKWW